MLYFWQKIIPIWIRTFLSKEVGIAVTDFFFLDLSALSKSTQASLSHCHTKSNRLSLKYTLHSIKVQVFWKGHKNLKKNLPLVLTLLSKRQNMWEIVFTILWPFHNVLTLKTMMDKSEKVIANIIDNKTFLYNV